MNFTENHSQTLISDSPEAHMLPGFTCGPIVRITQLEHLNLSGTLIDEFLFVPVQITKESHYQSGCNALFPAQDGVL